MSAVWRFQWNPLRKVNVPPKSAPSGDICIGSTLGMSPSLRWAQCRPDYRDSGIRSAAFAPMRCPLISRGRPLLATSHIISIGLVTTDHPSQTSRSAVGMNPVQKDCVEPGAYYDSNRYLGRYSMGTMHSRCPTFKVSLDFAPWVWGSGSNQLMCGDGVQSERFTVFF